MQIISSNDNFICLAVDDAQSSSVVDSSLTETTNVTALITSKSETGTLAFLELFL
jgi:hypothetical protein